MLRNFKRPVGCLRVYGIQKYVLAIQTLSVHFHRIIAPQYNWELSLVGHDV